MTDERQVITPEAAEEVRALLGIDAEVFKRTKLGQYIFDSVEGQENQLIEELIRMSLGSSDLAIVRCALDIQMQRMLPKFINEAISAGRGAEQNLKQMEGSETDY
jgi:hypothetical protein